MAIISATYNFTGSITVVTDVATMTVPNDMTNRDRRRLAAWEATGGVIAPYVAPAPTADQIRNDTFKALPERIDLLDKLKAATPAQIDTWLAANMTTLAQARVVLGTILKLLATSIRE